MVNQDYIDLINKYLSENTDENETKRLEDWVRSSPANKALFLEHKKAWIFSKQANSGLELNLDKEWASLNTKLGERPKIKNLKPKRSMPIFMRIAAAVLFMIAIALWFFMPQNKGQFAFASNKLILSEELPDGTKIELNKNSSLSYTEAAEGRLRKVKLKGDAFFDVKRDVKRPFKIETGSVDIEVLGTSFYVDNREGIDQVQVSVHTGSVAVRSNAQQVMLGKGESAVYNKNTKSLNKKTQTITNYYFLKDKSLKFENSSLTEVINDLERFYSIEVKLTNDQLLNCQLTAKYENKSLTEVLSFIEASLGIQTKIENNVVTFIGDQCN